MHESITGKCPDPVTKEGLATAAAWASIKADLARQEWLRQQLLKEFENA